MSIPGWFKRLPGTRILGLLNTYFDNQTTDGESDAFSVSTTPSWSAYLTGTSGALSATVSIYATKDEQHWTLVGTISLSVLNWTSTDDDAIGNLTPELFGSWLSCKAEISGLSGTGAAVSVVGG